MMINDVASELKLYGCFIHFKKNLRIDLLE